jgi:hypothetical protein
MNPQMGILYLSDTGHVLASFTRSAEPLNPESAPDQFVGQGLHVRVAGKPSDPDFDSLDFEILSANLKFTEIALDLGVLANPRDYYVDSSSRANAFTGGAVTLTPGGGKFTVTVPAVPASPSRFVILVQSSTQSGTHYLSPQLSTTSVNTNVDLSALASGKYHVLVCVPGYPVVPAEVNV